MGGGWACIPGKEVVVSFRRLAVRGCGGGEGAEVTGSVEV